MSIQVFIRIGQVSEAFSLLIVLIAFIFFNRRSLEAKIIGTYFALDILTFIFIHLVTLHGKEINVPQALCGTFQFLATIALYNAALNNKYKRIFLIVAIVYFIFSIMNLQFFQRQQINNYTSALASLSILIFCVVYWYRLMVELPVQELQRFPMFWYNSAFLIYSSGTLFLFLFVSYLTEVLHNDLLIYWSFHNILGIVHRIVIAIGLWQDLRNIKLGSSLPQAR